MHLPATYRIEPGETGMVYRFVSEGPRGDVAKVVIFSETGLAKLYRLDNKIS